MKTSVLQYTNIHTYVCCCTHNTGPRPFPSTRGGTNLKNTEMDIKYFILMSVIVQTYMYNSLEILYSFWFFCYCISIQILNIALYMYY